MKCERCGAAKAGLQIVNSKLAVMLLGKKPIEHVCEKCWAAEVRASEPVSVADEFDWDRHGDTPPVGDE